MSYVIAAPAQASIPVKDTHVRFPVRRIYCVGRNYNDHVVEMGGVPGREPPFFFQKPPDATLVGADFPYPPRTSNLHHEVELVVALGTGGKNIPVADAEAHIYGYAVGIDMTRRDLQAEAKKLARPWDVAKAFDHSAPVSEILPRSEIVGPLSNAVITLRVNGEEKQHSNISEMIWGVAEIISQLSQLFELHGGDIIFTGTPSGVGPLLPGDLVEAKIAGIGELNLRVYKLS